MAKASALFLERGPAGGYRLALTRTGRATGSSRGCGLPENLAVSEAYGASTNLRKRNAEGARKTSMLFSSVRVEGALILLPERLR